MNTEETGHKPPKRPHGLPGLPKIPTPDPALEEFNRGLAGITSELNAETRKPEDNTPPPRPSYPFVSLAEKCAQALVQTAEQALNEAQSNLEAAKAYAEELQQKIKQRDDEMANLTERLQAFGKNVLEAHTKFHEGEQS